MRQVYLPSVPRLLACLLHSFAALLAILRQSKCSLVLKKDLLAESEELSRENCYFVVFALRRSAAFVRQPQTMKHESQGESEGSAFPK